MTATSTQPDQTNPQNDQTTKPKNKKKTQDNNPMTTTTPKKDNYQVRYHENVVTKTLMFIPRQTVKGFGFLSGFWGYSMVVAPLAATYSLMLGVEAMYLALPVIPEIVETRSPLETLEAREEQFRQIRFVPKFGIDDGAKFSRVLPTKQTYNLIADATPVPQFVTKRLPADAQNIWDNPMMFLFAFGLCASMQFYERKIMSPKKVSDKKADFDKANKIKKVSADPNAVWLAHHKAAQVNRHGQAGVAVDNASIALVYGIELMTFLSTFKFTNVGWHLTLLYTALTVFGFELFMAQYNKAEQLR